MTKLSPHSTLSGDTGHFWSCSIRPPLPSSSLISSGGVAFPTLHLSDLTSLSSNFCPSPLPLQNTINNNNNKQLIFTECFLNAGHCSWCFTCITSFMFSINPGHGAAPSPFTEGQRQLEVSSPACSRLGLQLRQASLGSILLSHCPVGIFSSRLAS